ncbi:hypothetical protein ACFQFC_07690 [Amorphoplanes digitatis]|uniref:Uncharacterized protein n=1 Tax=Actinoplanes digitatis TaxID=1868 RepID=A0A7W7I0H8_9ACTN|nr:hypothetical protein [Actinoplanes digitatis]MBB4764085.1 hypothetical protein [Actinoplanes digitatis]BFE73422.1 hypothetical protein GCM10020092_067230 [Actinoplanes digitatis]GID97363.1 hypothetical protein Adi01nite_67750 [Actinoplanes digitatis]
MVQVDVFWSYAIGAGCGAAAARAGMREPAREPLDDRRLTATVLFLACVFAPSGIWLLWRFPGWETMHAAGAHADLPGWLVAAFAVTNISQGVIGYLVARELWRRGHHYLSWLQMPLGYLAMFFVLAYGWDGTGYRRFFAPTTADWRAGGFDPAAFLASDVALTLYAMGLVLVPLLLWMTAGWWSRGLEHPDAPGPARLAGLMLLAIFGLGLGTAAGAAALLTVLGPAAGAVAVAVLVAAAVHPRGAGGLLARPFLAGA